MSIITSKSRLRFGEKWWRVHCVFGEKCWLNAFAYAFAYLPLRIDAQCIHVEKNIEESIAFLEGNVL